MKHQLRESENIALVTREPNDYYGENNWIYMCNNCNRPVLPVQLKCRNCGSELDWSKTDHRIDWKLLKNSLNENLDADKTVVLAFGRINPPTIGHLKLANTLKDIASKYNADAQLYLSHSQDPVDNPLPYDKKLYWCRKAFGDIVNVVESPAKTVLEVLGNLYSEGVKNIVYVGGADRIGGDEDMSKLILKYNGRPDRTGNVIYNFDSIKFESAGNRNETSNNFTERVSAKLARKCVTDNDFDLFCKMMPFNEADCTELFNEISDYMFSGSLTEEMLTEAPMTTADFEKHNFKYSDAAIDDFMGKGMHSEVELLDGSKVDVSDKYDRSEFTDVENKLKDLKHLPNNKDRVNGFNAVTGIKWNNIFKGNYSGFKSGETVGLSAELACLDDEKIHNYIIDYLKNNYLNEKFGSRIESVEISSATHCGAENNRRRLSFADLFSTEDLFAGQEDNSDLGRQIADVVLYLRIKFDDGEEVDNYPVYLSVKMGPTVTPINLGLSKTDPNVIINCLTNYATGDEKALLKQVIGINGTRNTVECFDKNGNQINNWYYSLPESEINTDNLKNAIINSYSNGYFYIHLTNSNKIIEFTHIEDKLKKLRSESVTNAHLFVSHMRIDVIFNLGEYRCKLNIRQKGATTMFLTGELKISSADNASHNGTRVEKLSDYRFETV